MGGALGGVGHLVGWGTWWGGALGGVGHLVGGALGGVVIAIVDYHHSCLCVCACTSVCV